MKITLRTAFLLSAASLMAPAVSWAQDNEPVDEAAAAVGELVITARRVEETLQTVPGAVSAFSEAGLERIQASDVTGLQGAVPNLNIVQGRGSSNAANIYMRGVGQPDALQTFDPAVGLYVDDVYYSRIRGAQLDLLDLERVEVLRGPQGTLYGKNTIGGALKLVTRKPSDALRASAMVGIGSYDQREAKAAISGPLTENLAGGLSGLVSKRDGFVQDRVLDRDYNNKNTHAIRGALAYTPTETVRVDFSADYTRDDAHLNTGQPLNTLTTLFGGVVLAIPSPTPAYDFTVRTTPTLPNSTKLTHWGTAATIGWDISDAVTLKSITAYRSLRTADYVDIDATELELGDVFVGVIQDQTSQEFQLSYDAGGPLSAVGGVYYLRENIVSHQEAFADDLVGPVLGNPTFTRLVDDDLKTTSMAAFVNATYAVTDALRVSAGVRYTEEEKDYTRATSTLSSHPLLVSAAPFVFSPKSSWDDTSPMASVDYRINEDTMVYARVSKGFKSGGFNGRANSASEATEYDPETLVSTEIGLKTTLFDNLRINVAAFDSTYEDFQARVSGLETDPVTGLPLPVLSVLNAGELDISGAELEVAYTPVQGLLLDAQVGYLDAQYKEFADARFPGGSRAFQRPAFAPEWTARFGAQYRWDLMERGLITIGGQARYRSEHALAVDNTVIIGAVGTTTPVAGLFQDDYWVYDARAVFETPDGRYGLGIYGQNLTDEVYKTDGQDFSSIGAIRTVYYGAPRTVTFRFTARY